MPPKVSVCSDIRMAAQRKATRYPAENPTLRIRLLTTEKAVRLVTCCRSSVCVEPSLPTMVLSPSRVFMSMRFCMVSCSTLCTLESESRTLRVSFRICLT